MLRARKTNPQAAIGAPEITEGVSIMKASPTQLTLRELRKTCAAVQVVEKWNPHARIRQDLFGFVDVIALRGTDTIAIQSTSWTNVPARAKKIADSPLVAAVREAGWIVLIHGWRKGKNGRYECRVMDVS